MVDGLDLMSNIVKKRDINMRTNVQVVVNKRLSASGNTGFHYN